MSKVSNVLLAIVLIGFVAYKIYKLPKFSDGDDLESFSATLIDGSTLDSDDLKGSIVLLDFWGSWCGPCRKESPDLVSLHKDYHGKTFKSAKQFEIVSVAIETNEARWKAAIQKDQLHWKNHIVQLDRFSSPIAKQFGVKEIPTKYLINEAGTIIGVNQSFEEIRQYLDAQI